MLQNKKKKISGNITLYNKVKVKGLHMTQVKRQAGAYPSFCSMKRFGVFLLPLDVMLVYCRMGCWSKGPAGEDSR